MALRLRRPEGGSVDGMRSSRVAAVEVCQPVPVESTAAKSLLVLPGAKRRLGFPALAKILWGALFSLDCMAGGFV